MLGDAKARILCSASVNPPGLSGGFLCYGQDLLPLGNVGRMSVMSERYSMQVKERAVKMVLSHLDEYDSVYKAAFAIGPKLGVRGESLRRWVQADLARDTPEGV